MGVLMLSRKSSTRRPLRCVPEPDVPLFLRTCKPPDFTDANLKDATLLLPGGRITTNARMDGCRILFGRYVTGKERRALLASLSNEQRLGIVYRRWWQFWK